MLDEKQKSKNRDEKINNYLNVLEILSQSTDDFLFLLDIKKGMNWFFGDLEKKYNLIKKDERINTIEEMMGIVHPADRKKINDDIEQIVQGKIETKKKEKKSNPSKIIAIFLIIISFVLIGGGIYFTYLSNSKIPSIFSSVIFFLVAFCFKPNLSFISEKSISKSSANCLNVLPT